MVFATYHLLHLIVFIYFISLNQVYLTQWNYGFFTKVSISSIYSMKTINIANRFATSNNNTNHHVQLISSNNTVSRIKNDSVFEMNRFFYPITQYLKKTREKTLVFTYMRASGFANRLRAMRGALLMAMLNNASFCVNYDGYFSVMDNQVSILKCKQKISGAKWDDMYLKSRFQGNPCNYHIQQNTEIVTCYDLLMYFKKCSNFTTDLKRINPLIPTDNLPYYLSKFFFRPKPQIVSYGNYLISKMNGTRVGIQLRFGGSSAYSKEKGTFLNPDKLDNIQERIRSLLNLLINPYTVFLSTDSPLGKKVMSSINVPYITAEKYQVGHTRKENISHLQRAVTDLYILSKCSFILRTCKSTFGDLARILSNPRTCYILSN